MTNDQVNVREATTADLDKIVPLLKQLFEIESDFIFDYNKHYTGLKLLIESTASHIAVAEYDKMIIGMCTIQEHISTAEGGKVGIIEDMIIDEKHRGYEIGTKLLHFIEKIAVRKNYLRIQLVADKDNIKALNFYKKNQWAPTNLIALFKKKLF